MPSCMSRSRRSGPLSFPSITVGTPTTSGVSISWSPSAPAQGQIEYGTTIGYGFTSTLETSYLVFHSQALSGLTPGTLYHYRIKGVAQGGTTAYSADGTFTTAAAAGSYPSTAAISSVAINGDTMPGYLSTITDSTWGTQVRRVTNVDGRASTYPKCSAWNTDGTRIYIHGGQRLLNAATYADLGAIGTAGKGAYAVWSNVSASQMYGADDGQATGTGKLWTLDTGTVTWTALADFTLNTISGQARAYNYVEIGNYEGNVSNDDHLIALACNTVSNKSGQWDVIAYDPVSNVVRGTLAALGGQPSEVGVSQSGSYVYVNMPADGSGALQGCRLYDSTMVSVRQIVTYRPHLDMGYEDEAATVECLVNAQAGTIHRLSDGTSTDAFPGANPAIMGGHVSCRNLSLPGWSYWSDAQSANSAKRGYGQVVALKNDGSESVRVFGCHHEVADLADNGNYAVPSRDGTKVLVTSRWGASAVYAFVMGVTT